VFVARALTTYSFAARPSRADAARERSISDGRARARATAQRKTAMKTASRNTAARNSMGETNSVSVRTA
jgi:hypothetical protein